MNRKVSLLVSLLFVFTTSFVLLTYVNANEYSFNKTNEKQNLKEIVNESLMKAEQIKADKNEEKKWVIRVLVQAKMQNKNITDQEVLKEAKKVMLERKKWFEVAEKVYGIKVSDEELRNYISIELEKNKDLPIVTEVSQGLGINIEEFFYNFEADNFKKNLIWNKLKPILEKKYPMLENEKDHLLEYNNRLVNLFNSEVEVYVAQ
ncbi:MAG: hypothetical protein ACH0QD_10750 [Tepidibacillus sp.]|uniref:hypothetical protein n=1 Tax=Tepidibacillus sp. HK-1 TaxID=1883407 RepID=UPI000853705E|nr:hypothetical protein [Tepidibacillus sp. HK-1]GBF10314.1 hypothetical protein HK1_00326 [Tepidibacillus sp. HK-1]